MKQKIWSKNHKFSLVLTYLVGHFSCTNSKFSWLLRLVSLFSEYLNAYQTIGQEINSLDLKKATRPDGMPSEVIKASVEELSESLQIFFNHSVKIGDFPKEMKQAVISPVLKKENQNVKRI